MIIRESMLNWATTFFVITLIAAVLGLSGIAGMATQIAWILFVVGSILAVVFGVLGRRLWFNFWFQTKNGLKYSPVYLEIQRNPLTLIPLGGINENLTSYCITFDFSDRNHSFRLFQQRRKRGPWSLGRRSRRCGWLRVQCEKAKRPTRGRSQQRQDQSAGIQYP